METTNILTELEKEFSNIEAIKGQVIQAKKVQLHTGMEGFNSPTAYGIYRHTGGDALGVVGKDFEPCNLSLFLDSIVQSIETCGNGLNLSKLSYKEYKGGAKVTFELPIGERLLKTPMKGDIIESKLQFSTGFDGLTKFSLNFMTYRMWCSNGAKAWQKDISLSFKNTIGNQFKVQMFCNEILKVMANLDNYVKDLNSLVLQPVTKEQVSKFIEDLTGYNLKEYKEQTTRKRNILDKINESIAIEMQNTGANKFSLLQGITRYTTHNLANGSEEVLLFSNAAKINQTAHELILS